MALPPQTRDQGEPHPLGGRRPFRAGVIGCAVSVVLGGVVTLLADGDLRGAGVALLVLGAFAFLTLVVLRALETVALRHRGPAHGEPPPTASNGHGRPPPTASNGHGRPPRFRGRPRR